MSTCFADQPLTITSEKYKNARTRRERQKLLSVALPLCQTVADVRMLHTHTHPSDPLHVRICKRWDTIMLKKVESVLLWNIPRCHRFYLMTRLGSEAEAYVLREWRRLTFDGKSAARA
jgi:hypothetical protein